jgi:hypothetical protein
VHTLASDKCTYLGNLNPYQDMNHQPPCKVFSSPFPVQVPPIFPLRQNRYYFQPTTSWTVFSLWCEESVLEKLMLARHQWLTPVILATWEAKIGRIEVCRQIVRETTPHPPISKITREKGTWGMAQVVRVPILQAQGPEFKLQSHPSPEKNV